MSGISGAAAAAVAQAAAAVNMNEAKKGGSYTPPAAGVAIAIFVGYIETGAHAETFNGKEKNPAPQCELVFELHSANHSQRTNDAGERIPERVSIKCGLSLNEKATLYKVFRQMNYAGDATHIAQLLGRHFLVTVRHTTRGEGADAKTYATLKGDLGYQLTKPERPGDPLTGEAGVPIPCPQQLSQTRLFLWDFATKDMWDSIHIPGEWDDGKSKNVWQNKIRAAKNFVGSPIYDIINAGALEDAVAAVSTGQEVPANQQPAAAAAADPLAGIG